MLTLPRHEVKPIEILSKQMRMSTLQAAALTCLTWVSNVDLNTGVAMGVDMK